MEIGEGIMENKVYYLHSTLEIPLSEVEDHIKNLNPPDGLDSADIKRRSNTLIISAVVEDSDLGKYTPTAVIKGTVTELKLLKELTEEEIEALEPIVEFTKDAETWTLVRKLIHTMDWNANPGRNQKYYVKDRNT